MFACYHVYHHVWDAVVGENTERKKDVKFPETVAIEFLEFAVSFNCKLFTITNTSSRIMLLEKKATQIAITN